MLFCQACLVTLRTKLSSAVYCYQSCLCVCVCVCNGRVAYVCVCVCGSVTTITQKTDVKNAQAYQLDGDFCRGLLHVICPWVFRYFATPTGSHNFAPNPTVSTYCMDVNHRYLWYHANPTPVQASRLNRSVAMTWFYSACCCTRVHPQTICLFSRGIDSATLDASTICLCCSASFTPPWPLHDLDLDLVSSLLDIYLAVSVRLTMLHVVYSWCHCSFVVNRVSKPECFPQTRVLGYCCHIEKSRAVPNTHYVFAPVPNNGLNRLFIFGWIVMLDPRAGSGVVRIDLLCFLAGCRTRRLNQALSVLCLCLGEFWVYVLCC